jgi:PmbA protein
MDGEALLALAARVAAQAEPGEQLEAFVGQSRSTSVKAYNGEVEAFTSAESAGIGIRVIVDGRTGFASAGTLDAGIVADTLAEARDNARFSEPDEWAGLAVADGVSFIDQPLWFDEVIEFDTQAKIDFAIELERRVRAGDPRITGVRVASFADSAGVHAVATSTGIADWGRGTFCSLSVTALASDGKETCVGGGFDLARQPHLLDLDRAAADAVRRATAMLGATKPPSQRMRIIFEPRMAGALLGVVAGTLNGDAVLKKRSPFADRRGEMIASPLLTLVDDPTDARSIGADRTDGEGLACRRNALIVGGSLAGFLHDSYTGRRSGTASTGSAVRGVRSLPGPGAQALAVQPGSRSLAEIVASCDEAIVVRSMTGMHSGINAISGDFSVGIDGHRVRHGELAEPVREATIGSTLQRLLTDLVEVGSDLEWQPGGTGATTLVIDDVTVSGS